MWIKNWHAAWHATSITCQKLTFMSGYYEWKTQLQKSYCRTRWIKNNDMMCDTQITIQRYLYLEI